MNILIDKITLKLNLSEFTIKDLPVEKVADMDSIGKGLLYYDINDKPVYGKQKKFFLNGDLQFTLSPYVDKKAGGLYITSVPSSKSGYNIYALNHEQFKEHVESLEAQLGKYIKFKAGAFANATVYNLDLTKDIRTQFEFSEFVQLFDKLQARRMKRKVKAEQPDTYRFANTRQELLFYDKIKQLSFKKSMPKHFFGSDNLLRAELRLKKPKVIEEKTGIAKFSDMSSPYIYNSLEACFKDSVENLIFKTKYKGEEIEHGEEIGEPDLALMRYLKNNNSREVIYKFFILKVMEKDSTLVVEEIRSLMKKTGFHNTHISKTMRMLKEMMDLRSKILEGSSDHMAKIYNELRKKLLG